MCHSVTALLYLNTMFFLVKQIHGKPSAFLRDYYNILINPVRNRLDFSFRHINPSLNIPLY